MTSQTLEELARGASDPVLSFDHSDIEKRLMFPPGQFTSPGPILAPLLAVFATVGFYALMSLIPGTLLGDMFTKRGVVPYVIVFLSAWSLAILLVKSMKLSLQKKALKLRFLPTDDPGFVINPASALNVLEKLYRSVDDPKHFLLTRRINLALANLRNMGRIGDVGEMLSVQADNDEALVDSSYTVLKGFIWAIPVLGFIGTVLGLSTALGAFGGVLSSADKVDQLRSALQDVTGGLSTAFETTLQGLVAALCIHLLMIGVQRREEQFLDGCKDYCQKYIVGRLRLHTGGGSE
jgi:biopolymer transport protein ExbB/TolQ